MKRKSILFLTVILIALLSFTALGASVSQHLSSRFTVLSAFLYKEISVVSNSNTLNNEVAILPIMDVNGENPLLARYIHKKMCEVIGQFPTLRIVPLADVEKVWNELKAQGISNQDLYVEMSHRLGVSILLVSSMVTHPTHYTINGIILNTENFEQTQLNATVLERNILDTLTEAEMELALTPVSTSESDSTSSEPTTLESESTSASTEQNPTSSEQSTTTDTDSSSEDNSSSPETEEVVEQVPTEEVSTEPVYSESSEEETSGTEDKDAELVEVITDIITSAPETPAEDTSLSDNTSSTTPPIDEEEIIMSNFVLKEESPLLNNLLLGFDLGDLDGDGTVELIYCGGMNIQVRNLTTYEKIWDLQPYRPASKDYSVIAVDMDGDNSDEIISHGNLLKVIDNELVSQQPRFIARPVSLYGDTGINLYNDNAAFIVNYQGLVMKEYPIGGIGKRFIFTDLEGDGIEELVVIYDGEDENAKVQILTIDTESTKEAVTLDGTYGFSIQALDLNQNGRPELYLRKNFFNGVDFLYSKIYAFESVNGQLQMIAESQQLDYYIVDFAVYPKAQPERLVVGAMNLQSKLQSIQEIQSILFYYTLE